nr:hypothetical protein [Brucella intermedia]
MIYQVVNLENLVVNRANDRHGELENETAAIAWLFSNHSAHMRKLARDIVKASRLYEPPLVYPEGSKFIVYDGNRRTTCLKLLANPKRAPNIELQQFFAELRGSWIGDFPLSVTCQVETDRDEIDEILFRRHTGIQGGIGQSRWTGRMKTNFINRTGKGGKINLADAVEERLKEAHMLPENVKIPRSNFNRLLSAESFRNRVGITTIKGHLEFIRQEDVALKALARVAKDMAEKHTTLDDVWDAERKSLYLDSLETQGLLPTAAHALSVSPNKKTANQTSEASIKLPVRAKRIPKRTTLIAHEEYGVVWSGRIQRQKAIWNELQFKLELDLHPNAIAVLCRVLLELSVDNYISRTKLASISEADALVRKLIAVAENLQACGKLNKRYLEIVRKARNMDAIISVDTLNKYVHSANLAPNADHLTALWDTFAELVVLCLNE